MTQTPFQTLVALLMAGDEARARVAAEHIAAVGQLRTPPSALDARDWLDMASFVADNREASS